jgi:DNA-binding ferritin-like protein
VRDSTVLLADDLFTVAHDDRTGRPRVGPRVLGLGLAAALLGELIFFQNLAVEDGAVYVISREPPRDSLAHATLTQLLTQQQHREVRTWLAFLAETAVDLVAERIRVLGGVGLAMAPDIAETTIIPRPPRGREEVPVQISRLLHAHEIVIKEARTMARQAAESGDDGTNDLIVSNIIRTNELQVWFVAEHIVDVPLVHAD